MNEQASAKKVAAHLWRERCRVRETPARRVVIALSVASNEGFLLPEVHGIGGAKVNDRMKDQRHILTLRVSLTLAIAAALAVVAIAQFKLRPQIQELSRERAEFSRLSDQRFARAIEAEAHARQVGEQLVNNQKQTDAALLEVKRLMDGNARLIIDLEESRAKLHSAKQEVARWNATGTTPDQVAFLAGENKTLAAKASRLEKEKEKILIDYANLKRTLDVPTDDDIIPTLRPMKGSVLVVDPKWNFVVLDIGENDGLRKNGVFMVSREGKLVAKLKVRRVESERSIADILPGWRISEVREGDQVIN